MSKQLTVGNLRVLLRKQPMDALVYINLGPGNIKHMGWTELFWDGIAIDIEPDENFPCSVEGAIEGLEKVEYKKNLKVFAYNSSANEVCFLKIVSVKRRMNRVTIYTEKES